MQKYIFSLKQYYQKYIFSELRPQNSKREVHDATELIE